MRASCDSQVYFNFELTSFPVLDFGDTGNLKLSLHINNVQKCTGVVYLKCDLGGFNEKRQTWDEFFPRRYR